MRKTNRRFGIKVASKWSDSQEEGMPLLPSTLHYMGDSKGDVS
tara:strand:+ start:834 stop:962 length:129 start_codon:yes stop_codon:yes gene_type:complete